MNRRIAGVYDPSAAESRETTRARVTAALGAGGEVKIVEDGPLTLGWVAPDGPPPARGAGVLCLMDGHLYNAAEVAPADPTANGRPAFGDGDELVLARAFGRGGEEALPGLRGDFALVLFDTERRRGILCCDQRGGRSLVFHTAGERLLFASEARDVVRMLPRRPDPDLASLAHWIGISGPPADRTMFAGVRRVRPGHVVRFGAGPPEQRAFWLPRYRGTVRMSREEASAEIREAVVRAIDRRAPTGETSAVMLSGGLDSSSVCALATRSLPRERRPVAGYSAVFPSHVSVDESQLIEELTGKLALPSVRIAVEDGSILAGALEYIDTWQLPPTSPNLFFWIPLLRRASHDGVRVLLDGEGGDELFAFSGYLLADRLTRGRLASTVSLARSFPSGSRHVSPKRLWRRLNEYALRPALPHWLRRARRRFRAPGDQNPAWFAPATAEAYVETDEQWAWRDTPGPRWAAWWGHTLTWSAGPVAGYDHIRRRAALCGQEARHPLSDVDLIELMLSIPPEYAFDPRHDRPLFRQAVEGITPDSIRLRSVKSFFDELFQEVLQGHDLEPTRRLLAPPDAELGAYVDLKVLVRDLLDGTPPTAPGPRRDWCVQVWRLITAECWLRTLADPAFPEQMLAAGTLTPASYDLLAPF